MPIDDARTVFERAAELMVVYSFSVLGALLTIILGFIVAGIAKRWTSNALSRLRHDDPTLNDFLSNLARYAVLTVFGVAVLAQFGIQTASILAALGAAGLAIGLALQGTLQNVAAGVMLLLLRPFRVGEYIDAGGTDGTVEEIGLFATRMKTLDGLFRMVPNSELWNVPITNYTRYATRRNDLVIGIGYDDDIELAEKALEEIAGAEDRVLGEPAPQTFVSELGDSAVSITLRYWTQTPDWFATANHLRGEAKRVFDGKGISIPFPQQDIHVVSQPASDAA